MRRLVGLSIAALVLPALAGAPGQAQPSLAGAADGKPKLAQTPPGPVLAVVSLAKQRLLIYDANGVVAQSAVSTGMPGHRTPAGVFSVLQKRRFHHSNIYSNAPMPYMQRLTWSGIALHAGVLPGYPASHGCIRLPHHFAAELWRITKVGTRVVVVPDDASASLIDHPRLPAPRLAPMPPDDRLGDEAASKAASKAQGPELASASGLKVADAGDELDRARVQLLDPLQRAKAGRTQALADAAGKEKAAKLVAALSAAKAAAARDATAALRAAELALAAATRRREAAERALAMARDPKAVERASQALVAASVAFAEAQRVADGARLTEAVLVHEAAEAASAAAEAEAARRQALAIAKASERALEPISIFVSRKAGRVYIRQGWQPVHEAPVTFSEAGPLLGTHVYQAMGPAAEGGAMRWLTVSIPPSPRPPRRGVGPGAGASTDPGPGSSPPHETATSVLARFELPETTQRFIADLLWAGASLIVSDQGLSGETGMGTDFIVLTR